MRSTMFTGPAFLVLACLGACASNGAQSEVDWRNGAKHGWIAGFYTAETPRSALPACLAEVPQEQLAAHRFVRIDYRHVRRMVVEVAELPEPGVDQPAVKIGDRVELWPHDCAEGRLSRISKMMPVQAQ